MTPSQIRNATILSLTLCGVILLAWTTTREDPMAGRMVAGLGCFLLARVYAEITRPGGGDRG